MQEVARAKINLALHVRGREPDGYHRLETLFAFAEDGDLLRVWKAPELTLEIEGEFAAGLSAGEDNLVLRAAMALRERFQVADGAALVLDKRLPVASGIGGGSADAAAALRLLNRFWRLGAGEEQLLELARTLGADVPACLLSRTCIGSGRGDRLTPHAGSGLAGTPLLLITPGVAVPTADVFRRWAGEDGGPLPADPAAGRNDLEPAAIAVAPEIEEVLADLRAVPGLAWARMSGSGATCFGLFDSAAARDAARERIAAARPGWWLLATRLA